MAKIELTEETKLTDYCLVKAGFTLYCSEYADLFEEHGGSYSGQEITDCVKEPHHTKLIPIMRVYEQKLADAWGFAPSYVFAEMGLEDEDEIADAFYYTLMGCRGHGVCLKDDFSDAIDVYEEKHEPLDSWTSPFHTELTELNELAYDNLETPDPQWGAFDADGDLVEGKFHSEKAAEQYLEDTGLDEDGYTVKKIEDS